MMLPKSVILCVLLLTRIAFSEASSASSSCHDGPVLVVGATGATGKHVVQQLLDQQRQVRVVVRSKSRMLDLLGDIVDTSNLDITEASLLDLSTTQLQTLVDGTSSVVSCLGHTMSLQGMFGQPRQLVTAATQRLSDAMLASTVSTGCSHPKKFILMSSDGVSHPNDPQRPTVERVLLWLIRYLIPPHADNEGAADYLLNTVGTDRNLQWAVVRPTDLVDATVATEYKTYDTPHGSLFGGSVVARATVAKFMVDLLIEEAVWNVHTFRYPVVHNAVQPHAETEL